MEHTKLNYLITLLEGVLSNNYDNK